MYRQEPPPAQAVAGRLMIGAEILSGALRSTFVLDESVSVPEPGFESTS